LIYGYSPNILGYILDKEEITPEKIYDEYFEQLSLNYISFQIIRLRNEPKLII
jgi:hypothetical protein